MPITPELLKSLQIGEYKMVFEFSDGSEEEYEFPAMIQIEGLIKSFLRH